MPLSSRCQLLAVRNDTQLLILLWGGMDPASSTCSPGAARQGQVSKEEMQRSSPQCSEPDICPTGLHCSPLEYVTPHGSLAPLKRVEVLCPAPTFESWQ